MSAQEHVLKGIAEQFAAIGDKIVAEVKDSSREPFVEPARFKYGKDPRFLTLNPLSAMPLHEGSVLGAGTNVVGVVRTEQKS